MSESIRALKERMDRSLARQSWKDALAACLKLRELDPKDERVMLRLGEVYERLGRIDEAVAAFREVVDHYADDGRLVRAISVAKRIVALKPGDEVAEKKLALLYSARGIPAPRPAAAAPAASTQPAAPPEPAGEAASPSATATESATTASGAAPTASEAVPTASEAAPTDPKPAATAPKPAPGPAPAPAGVKPVPVAVPTPIQKTPGTSQPEKPGTPQPETPGTPQPETPGTPPLQSAIDLRALGATDPFAESDAERLRRSLGTAELAEIDLGELDLAFVEIAPADAPKVPPTPLFSELAPEELHQVMRRLEARKFGDGEAVVRQGEVGDSVFIVSEGRVRVRVRRGDGEETEVAALEEGAFFGEFGVFTDGLRHATVLADGDIEVLEMRQADLAEISVENPRFGDVLTRYYRERAVETALATSSLFGPLDGDDRRAVAKMVAEERHMAGSTVVQEGDDGSGLYLVRRGRLEVRNSGIGDDPIILAELGPGDFFGEISALTGVLVTADVISLEPSELLKLSRHEILLLCEEHPRIREALEQARDRRLHDAIERLGGQGVV